MTVYYTRIPLFRRLFFDRKLGLGGVLNGIAAEVEAKNLPRRRQTGRDQTAVEILDRQQHLLAARNVNVGLARDDQRHHLNAKLGILQRHATDVIGNTSDTAGAV